MKKWKRNLAVFLAGLMLVMPMTEYIPVLAAETAVESVTDYGSLETDTSDIEISNNEILPEEGMREETTEEASSEESSSGEAASEEAETEKDTSEEEITKDNTSEENISEEESTEEELSEEEISEEDLSEEDIIGEELLGAEIYTKEEIEKARVDLKEMLEARPVMALIYLCSEYEAKKEPYAESPAVALLASGKQVQIQDFEITDGEIWYQVTVLIDGVEVTAYVEKEYLAYSDERFISWEKEWFEGTLNKVLNADTFSQEVSYEDIEQFPESYQGDLYALKQQHPKWTFVRMDTGIDWSTAVKNEVNADEDRSRNLIPASSPEAWKYPGYKNSSWAYASEAAVKYFMDPRNFFREAYIFMFEQLTYNSSYHTESGVQTFLNSTFMKGEIPSNGMTYAHAFWEIGSNLGVSPYHLASRVYQEQGKGTSPLISGTYPGYEGYYNYFNVGATGVSDTEEIVNGLKKAKEKGWNTRYKSLSGGASVISANYILRGQDCLYLQKFDVDSSDGSLYWHQYMQNIIAPSSEAQSILKLYRNSGSLENTFVFKIPVYKNMPENRCMLEGKDSLTLDQTSYTLNKGETLKLSVKLNQVAAEVSKLTFTSSAPEIVSVDENGFICAVDSGEAIVTITMDDLSTSCKISVKNPLKGIELINSDKEVISELNLIRGSSYDLQVLYDPEDTTDNKKVTWSTSDYKVVTVSNGTLTAKNTGTARITAKVGNFKAECIVTVVVPLESISFEQEISSLYVGETRSLSVILNPADTTDEVNMIWESSNPDVISVENGFLTALKPGNSIITAKTGKLETSISVEVKACTLYFIDGDEVYLTKEYTFNEKVSELPYIDKGENWQFEGWFTEKGGKGLKLTESYRMKGDLRVYACFNDLEGGMFVTPVGDQYYTGSSIKPQPAVYDARGVLLQKGRDYTISWKNNTKINSEIDKTSVAQVIITGKGNYKGTVKIPFCILKKDISDEDITVEMTVLAANRKVQKPSPVVTRNGKKLVKGKDYTVSYPDTQTGAYKEPGSYSLLITGKGGYEGSVNAELVITSVSPVVKLSIASIPAQKYSETEEGVCPPLTVKDPLTKSTLKAGVDYLVKYENNKLPGTAYAVISGVEERGYIGTKRVSYKINGTAISKAKVSGLKAKVVWEGEAVTQPDISLTLTESDGTVKTLQRDRDYEISYQKNDKAGTAYAVLKGKGGYTGTLKKAFKIAARTWTKEDLPTITFSADDSEFAYEKGGVKPEITVTYQGKVLVKNKDYTISYKNNTKLNDGSDAAKAPTVTITGKGSYKGKVSAFFTIKQQELSKVKVTAKDVTYSTAKGKWKAAPNVTDINGKKMSAGTDYDKLIVYTYVNDTYLNDKDNTFRKAGEAVQNNDKVPAGTEIRIKITSNSKKAITNYTGEQAECTYRVVSAQINSASVKVKTSKIYDTGSAVTLTGDDLKVTYKKQTLTENEDYIILESSYKKNTVKGTAKVTIQGIGNYGGTKTISFTIGAKPIMITTETDP